MTVFPAATLKATKLNSDFRRITTVIDHANYEFFLKKNEMLRIYLKK